MYDAGMVFTPRTKGQTLPCHDVRRMYEHDFAVSVVLRQIRASCFLFLFCDHMVSVSLRCFPGKLLCRAIANSLLAVSVLGGRYKNRNKAR